MAGRARGAATAWRVRVPALLVLLAVVVAVGMPSARAAAGDLDRSFSGDGTLLLGFGRGTSGLSGLAVRSDGKIVVAGTGRHGGRSVFEIARLLANGRLDPTFGNHGRTVVGFPGKEPSSPFLLFTPKVALAPDGGIVLAGAVSGPAASAKRDIALLRLSPGGALDPSFGDGGRVITSLGPGDDFATDVAIDGNGRIVVSADVEHETTAAAALRYLPSGALDDSFGAHGVATVPTPVDAAALAVVLAPDGKVVLCGFAGPTVGNTKVLVARLTADGRPDRTFGGSGRSMFGFQRHSLGFDVALTPEGRIVVAGVTSPNGDLDEHTSIAVARLNSLGELDPSFGTGGRVMTNTGGGDLAMGVAVQSDGRIVAVGSSDLQTLLGKHLEVLRYTRAGKLDPTFNTIGVVDIDLGPSSEAWGDVDLRGGRVTVDGLVVTTSSSFGHSTGAVARFLR
ncbi:MAG TPA: hypothetical protein VID47_02620 [Actinomycetota bacterium]